MNRVFLVLSLMIFAGCTNGGATWVPLITVNGLEKSTFDYRPFFTEPGTKACEGKTPGTVMTKPRLIGELADGGGAFELTITPNRSLIVQGENVDFYHSVWTGKDSKIIGDFGEAAGEEVDGQPVLVVTFSTSKQIPPGLRGQTFKIPAQKKEYQCK